MLEQKHNEEQKADAALGQPAYCKTDVSRSPCLSESDVLQFGLKCYNDGLYDGKCNLKGGESIVQKFQNFVGRQKSPKEIINDVAQRFEEVKPMLDKYPKSFSLIWSEENGYCLSVDLDCLERLPVSADLSL